MYLFNSVSRHRLETTGIRNVKRNKAILTIKDEIAFKEEFFKLLHLFKAKSLLDDYYDLNKRYFKTSDTIIFQDDKVKFDIIPNCYFALIKDSLLDMAFSKADNLELNCELSAIKTSLAVTQEQDRFSQLYKIIHESDEGAFSSVFNRKAASLELQVKFKDGNMYPPNAVHSEGHQDSMGICLFFALSEKISNSRLNLVLLDDVVMSIDIDHRKNFCKLLKEQFPQKQFIITTHDYIWRKELESQGVVTKKNIIHFKTWNIEHGPYVEIGSNIWDAINSHLDKGEKNEAIGLMRYYMEEFFSDICAKYKLKVPYSTSGRWSLEEVLSPVNAHYRQAIKRAKESANSFKKPIDKIEIYEKSYVSAYDNLQVERWTINPSTHFTVWAQSLSIDELKSTCSAVKEFCEIFECSNCKSLITINSDINLMPQNICCDCGDYSFSCIKKK